MFWQGWRKRNLHNLSNLCQNSASKRDYICVQLLPGEITGCKWSYSSIRHRMPMITILMAIIGSCLGTGHSSCQIKRCWTYCPTHNFTHRARIQFFLKSHFSILTEKTSQEPIRNCHKLSFHECVTWLTWHFTSFWGIILRCNRVGGQMCLCVHIMPSCSLPWKTATPHCVVLADKKVVLEWARETTGEHTYRAVED